MFFQKTCPIPTTEERDVIARIVVPSHVAQIRKAIGLAAANLTAADVTGVYELDWSADEDGTVYHETHVTTATAIYVYRLQSSRNRMGWGVETKNYTVRYGRRIENAITHNYITATVAYLEKNAVRIY